VAEIEMASEVIIKRERIKGLDRVLEERNRRANDEPWVVVNRTGGITDKTLSRSWSLN